ncbi:DUF6134 family protein [Reyranella sp.]|uniref:DUF6134 family protein n=1 Tax=Reyranella sp. TaxID=1929291 RepID=UPI003D122399
MVRLLALATALLSIWPVVAVAETPVYGRQLVFAAYRNGQPIGAHRLDFDRQGDRLVVTISIELAVKVVGITAYRYTHRGREVLRGKELVTFDSSTNDDGKPYAVRASREPDQLRVERTVPGATGLIRDSLPPDLLPSTHWNVYQTSQGFLLNAQKGTRERIAVITAGRESVRTLSGEIAATRYRYEGDVRMDQWFDDRGRWVRSRFVVFDGSSIDYVLQD